MPMTVPISVPADIIATYPSDDETLRPCLTRKLGIQPLNSHTVNISTMLVTNDVIVIPMTFRLNSIRIGGASCVVGSRLPNGSQGVQAPPSTCPDAASAFTLRALLPNP